jgi:uncharacterized protein
MRNAKYNMKDPANPFLITGYISPSFFCDREEETKRILDAIENNRNLTLLSLRRMGKTGLIHHVFEKLRKSGAAHCVYLDILPVTNLQQFTEHLCKAVLEKTETTPARIMKKIGNFFTNINPAFTYDPMTGMPSLELRLHSKSQAEETLERIFAMMKKEQKRLVIAIDEFQQIVNFPEKNMEALLRSHIQRSGNVNFIFSGSHKHILLSMFSGHGKPFYQSTEIMNLEKIPHEKYLKFIASKFSEGGKKIKLEDIEFILEWTRGHTYYVQYACNKLFASPEKKLSREYISRALLTILAENEVVYYNYRNLLTDTQWKLMKSIAEEGFVAMPTSGEFIRKHDLVSPSSVKTALLALAEKEMIFENEKGWQVYDVFFSMWLQRI